ncbi:MAG: carbonic anhydrase [Bdellovibrionota bacterium]
MGALIDLGITKGFDSFASSKQALLLKKLVRDGQQPKSIVVTCSDSRVAPEIIFEADIGQLFVIRVAGNVIDSHVVASIEYAATALNVSNCIVMGHSGCGAVSETLKCVHENNVPPTDALEKLVSCIEPSVSIAAKKFQSLSTEEYLSQAIKEHVKSMAREILSSSTVIREKVHDGSFIVVPAFFDMGEVSLEWLNSRA